MGPSLFVARLSTTFGIRTMLFFDGIPDGHLAINLAVWLAPPVVVFLAVRLLIWVLFGLVEPRGRY